MCEAAVANGHGEEIAKGSPREDLLHAAIWCSNEAVQGLRQVNFRLDDAECKQLRPEYQCHIHELQDEVVSIDDTCDLLGLNWEFAPCVEAIARLDAWQFSEKYAFLVFK